MSNDVRLNVDLDTNRVTAKLQELRAQIGTQIGQAFGMGGTGMYGGRLGPAPNLGGSGFGHTFTNSAMAYSPHYGAIQAHSTFEQEQAIADYGLAAAQNLKPPGVSPGAYAARVMENAIGRDIAAKEGAAFAFQREMGVNVAGFIAGGVGMRVGARVGSGLGSMLGGRLFGAGSGAAAGATIGKGIGYFGGMLGAGYFAATAVGDHFAEVEQIRGVTGELGELAGAGRGLGRAQRYELGRAARMAAGDINMDVNQMGDILALGRESGMLPNATNPGQAREQFKDFARTIEEGAQVLKSSLASATAVIRAATQSGMSAQEGIARAAAAGGPEAFIAQRARLNAFGSAGAGVGIGLGFTGAQGRGTFMGALGVESNLTSHQTAALGGPMGAAQFVGGTQMAMAASGLGDAQLMAAMGGGDIGAGGMLGLAGAAMEGLTGDGDFISNALRFQMNKHEYRRGLGKQGIQTMVRSQLQMGGELLQQFAPDLSAREAQVSYAMSMGMNPDQARALVFGGRGGRGGGLSNAAIGRAGAAYAQQRFGSIQGPMTRAEAEGLAEAGSGGISFDGLIYGAMAGMSLPGGPLTSIAGAVGGFVYDNYDTFKRFLDGPSILSSAEEKADFYERRSRGEYDARVQRMRETLGVIDVDASDIERAMGVGDDSFGVTFFGTEMQMGGVRGAMAAAGYGAAGGSGMFAVGGRGASLSQVQRDIRRTFTTKKLSRKDQRTITDLAIDARYGAASQNYDLMPKGTATISAPVGRVLGDIAPTLKMPLGLDMTLDANVGRTAMATIASRDAFTPQDVFVETGLYMSKANAGEAYVELARSTIGRLDEADQQRFLNKDGTIDFMGVQTVSFMAKSLGFEDVEGFRRGFSVDTAAALGAGHAAMAETARTNFVRHFERAAPRVSDARVEQKAKDLYLMHELRAYNRGEDTDDPRVLERVRGGVRHDVRKELEAADAQLRGKKMEAASQTLYEKLAPWREENAKLDGARTEEQAQRFTRAIQETNMLHGDIFKETDPYKKIERPGLVPQVARTVGFALDKVLAKEEQLQAEATENVSLPETSGMSMASFGDKPISRFLEEKGFTQMTIAKDSAEATQSGLDTDGKPKGKGRRGDMLQRAAGFGQREDAMSTIVRSLKHTEKTLRVLYDEVRPKNGKGGANMSTPDGPAQG